MKKTINLGKLEKIIKKSSASSEEKEELNSIVQEIVHHRVIGCILDNLDRIHHDEFLEKILNKKNIDEEIISFLEEKSGRQISEKIQITIQEIENEILQEIN